MNSKYWFGPIMGYHGGDEQPGDIEVPERPTPFHVWDILTSSWVLSIQGQIDKLTAEATQDELDNPITQRGMEDMFLFLSTSNSVLTPAQILALPEKHGLRRLLERKQRQDARRTQITTLKSQV